ELLVKALPGGKVLLAGGVRGIYYAATEFLELAGCRFYSIDARHIPHCKELRLDDGLKVQRSPFFKMRSCYIGGPNERFYIWNKQNGEYLSACLEEAVVGKAHSMTDLSAKFPEHVFALNENGKRCPGPSGQLCFSSSEARRLMKDSVAATIEKSNRERAAKGLPKARFFRISQNDNNVRCQCSECRALVEKYGSESGLLLDFINEIAASFPDLNIVTFAYRFTRYPPRPGSIKAAPNVMIQIALQSLEWGDGETRNLLLPWNDRRNDEARKLIEAWGNFATMFQVWDYGRFYQQAQAVPYTCLKAILGNMPFYARNKIQAYFLENEFGYRSNGVLETHAFQELELYAAIKLMDNPFQDQEKLLKDFFDGYYGAASKDMREYLDFLLERQTEMPPMERRYFATWDYLDADFYRKSCVLLESALAKVQGNQALTERVLFEVVPLYSSLLVKLPYFEQRKEVFSFAKEELLRRLESASATVCRRYFPKSADTEKLRLKAFSDVKPALPPEIGNRSYKVFIPASGMTPDADSCMGYSRKLDAKVNHSRKPEFGIYNPVARKMVMRKILEAYPEDEKFHLHKIGTAPISSELPYIFAHWTWRFTFRIGNYTPDMAEQPVEMWVSAKLQGPAYVKGSNKPNLFAVDYILFVSGEQK
ncbi:MAG: DUF4838 domain-containing protein, partial [Victivallales bacterium]|nr:DUF4838 domain-containing protein [Victivallales bacterium]